MGLRQGFNRCGLGGRPCHYNREIKVKGVVLPGRALAGQKRRQHMKEKDKKTLDTVCRAHISTFEYTITALIRCCLDGGSSGFLWGPKTKLLP